jgi:hypothetical protein
MMAERRCSIAATLSTSDILDRPRFSRINPLIDQVGKQNKVPKAITQLSGNHLCRTANGLIAIQKHFMKDCIPSPLACWRAFAAATTRESRPTAKANIVARAAYKNNCKAR